MRDVAADNNDENKRKRNSIDCKKRKAAFFSLTACILAYFSFFLVTSLLVV